MCLTEPGEVSVARIPIIIRGGICQACLCVCACVSNWLNDTLISRLPVEFSFAKFRRCCCGDAPCAASITVRAGLDLGIAASNSLSQRHVENVEIASDSKYHANYRKGNFGKKRWDIENPPLPIICSRRNTIPRNKRIFARALDNSRF